jgi:hypothetical protein
VIIAVKGTGAMNIDLRGLTEGDTLELVAEPDNAYDPRAIKVERKGRLLGYVPKELAARISADDYSASVAIVLPHPETGIPAGLRISIERKAA